MSTVRRIVIDVLKPHDPSLLEFTQALAELKCLESVTTSLIEHDKEVQNVELALEGEDVEYDAIEERIEELSGTIHSVDQVSCGEYVIEDPRTRQID